jgi:hypothetical protein
MQYQRPNLETTWGTDFVAEVGPYPRMSATDLIVAPGRER